MALAENLASNPGFEQIEPDGICSRRFEVGYSRENDQGACKFLTDPSRVEITKMLSNAKIELTTKSLRLHLGKRDLKLLRLSMAK